MAKLKIDFEKQLTRKSKRQSTFDLSRDLDFIITERDGLRELSNTFRHVLSELAKCVSVCEDDLNLTFLEEIQKIGHGDVTNNELNGSLLMNSTHNSSKRFRLAPDVSGLLSLLDDPKLVDFITEKSEEKENFNLRDCLEKLKSEADYLYELSENLNKRHNSNNDTYHEKNDSCEEDGLKSQSKRTPQKILRANSLNEALLRETTRNANFADIQTSLPPDLNRLTFQTDSILEDFTPSGSVSELNFQVNELKNRLLKSETDRLQLQKELEGTIKRNHELGMELNCLKEQLDQLDSHREDYTEGYALGLIKSPERRRAAKNATSFSQLQEKARYLLSTPTKSTNEDNVSLLQMIEDFCREGDKVVESSKRDREDLQSQVELLEQQIKELSHETSESQSKKDKLEIELKASIDKIFVLREIISELETQIETKALNEHVLEEKVTQLEAYANNQNRSNVSLQNEVESLKLEIGQGYQEKIGQLEEQLRNSRPSAEQNVIIEQIVEQMHDIETTLEQKTKTLEALHHSVSSVSCSTNPGEDVSVQAKVPEYEGSPVHPSPRQPHSLPIADLQRVMDKLSKHTRAEEAAIKRIRDLEMQVFNIRSSYAEIQHERDNLQDRMTEQMLRIASLQSKLEEQRHRAEELQRQGTSGLNIRIHDLQNEIHNLKETLSMRDKQMNDLKNQLEQSRIVLDRQEAELNLKSDRSLVDKLEGELKTRTNENKLLKEKIKNEMINKLALPDLMETILAEKNEEIDQLKDQLDMKDKEMQNILDIGNLSQDESNGKTRGKDDIADTKLSARTLSDIVSISEYDEPDVIRRAHLDADTPLMLPDSQRFLTMETSKEAIANLTEKRTADLTIFSKLHPASTFDNPHYFQDPSVPVTGKDGSSIITPCVPRQINFSEFADESKKQSTPKFDQNSSESEERKALREKLSSANNEVESLKLKLDELKNEKDVESQTLNKNLQSQIKLYEELLKEKNDLDEKIADLESRLSQKEETVQNILADKNKLAEKITDLESKLILGTEKSKDGEVARQNLIAEKNQLAEKIDDLETKLKSSAELQDDLVSSKMKQGQVEDERDIINQQLEDKSDELIRSAESIKLLEKRISELEKECERLRSQNSESSKPFSIDELAAQVEKELNYSAQLDSNILKAIESEEENNFDDNTGKFSENDLLNQLHTLRAQLEVERGSSEEIRQELLKLKMDSEEIQEQDVAIIEATRTRLEEALANEQKLRQLLDAEREKCERLVTQISVLQRSEAKKSSFLLKSPPESPRKSPRSMDFEMELAERLRSEIKLLQSQNERERERVVDLQRNLDRERNRFETELTDRIEYSDKLSREMDKLARDKDSAEQECEHLQERLAVQSQEIESLENRIATLQDSETRRVSRRDRELSERTQHVVELQELRSKVSTMEVERDHLNQNIALLRSDISRGAEREAKLADTVANSSGSSSIPIQFMQKMKEMNNLLAENTKENRQMSETVQLLIEERRCLQKKCEDLELISGSNGNKQMNFAKLEERANYLLGRYLRVESHRKSLVHQKRYLLVSLRCYEQSEARAMALIGSSSSMFDSLQPNSKEKRSFKTVALAVIAVKRMEYLVRRWFSPGKRIVSTSVFTLTQQRPTQQPSTSSNNNVWAPVYTSAPCKDFSSPQKQQHSPFNLQSPALISEFEQQKFNWAKLKK